MDWQGQHSFHGEKESAVQEFNEHSDIPTWPPKLLRASGAVLAGCYIDFFFLGGGEKVGRKLFCFVLFLFGDLVGSVLFDTEFKCQMQYLSLRKPLPHSTSCSLRGIGKLK